MATDFARRLFTVDDYHRMAEAGILTPDDRVELLGGEILEMTPIGAPHVGCVVVLSELLFDRLRRRATTTIQSPLILDDFSEPEPDLAVCRWRDDRYRTALPRPDDVHLIIEVADSSRRRDRELKIPLYARAGIPEVWLVDLVEERIDVYRNPSPTGYVDTATTERGGHVASATFPDVDLSVDDILGPPPASSG